MELDKIRIETYDHQPSKVDVEFTLLFGSSTADMGIVLEALTALREYLQDWEAEQGMTAQEKLEAHMAKKKHLQEVVLDFPPPGKVVEGETFEGVSVPLNKAEPVEFTAPDPDEFAAGLKAAIEEARLEKVNPFDLPEDTDETPSAASLLSDNYEGDE